jgi:tRNA-specific 2-thiouridylase
MSEKPLVFVMMSGGVDSSVAALILKNQGYNVVGVFMKCWSIDQLESLGASRDLYGCFWEDDSNDARLVAGKLGIPFYVWDFQEEYKQKVVDYMLSEYKAGRTPNPDVMCNSVIKFGIFYERARQLGAEFVATGHYARILPNPLEQNLSTPMIARGDDENKDQSYFLWRVKREQISRILFPIGEFKTKAEVREMAQKYDLITAQKPDSQGLCFIGTTPLRELLLQTLGKKEGNIVDEHGAVLGVHPGAYLYTIGQREKLGLAGGPWFVSQIRIDSNEVVVSHQTHQENLYKQELRAGDFNVQVDEDYLRKLGFSLDKKSFQCQAQVRYRQTPEDCEAQIMDTGEVTVRFSQPVRAVASGQSLVLYDKEVMLGGGVIL